jgi:hypothetical protein
MMNVLTISWIIVGGVMGWASYKLFMMDLRQHRKVDKGDIIFWGIECSFGFTVLYYSYKLHLGGFSPVVSIFGLIFMFPWEWDNLVRKFSKPTRCVWCGEVVTDYGQLECRDCRDCRDAIRENAEKKRKAKNG